MSLHQMGRSIYTNGSNLVSYLLPKLPSRYKVLGAITVLVIVKLAIDRLQGKRASQADLKNWTTAPELTDSQKAFSQRVNHFSAMVYQKYSSAKQGKNFLFFSPNLIAILSLIYSGAPRALKQTFAKEFKIDEEFTEEQWHQELQHLNRSLEDRAEKSKPKDQSFLNKVIDTVQSIGQKSTELIYQASHAIAIQKGAVLNMETFGTVVQYKPEVIHFDSAKEAEQKANQWVDEKTEGKIKDLVRNLNSETVFMFITTSIFGGKWVYPFEPAWTQKGTFYNADGTAVSVDMMAKGTDELRYGYFKIEQPRILGKKIGFNILELPFHQNVVMMIARPKEKSYESQMDVLMEEENFQSLTKYISSEEFKKRASLRIKVPKFTSEDEMDLMSDFKSWELMEQVKNADFNDSLVKTPNDSRPLKTDKIASRTLFKMDENGVKLVAASYSPSGRQSCDPSCNINSPFIYFFFDQQTKTVLGCGRVLKLDGPKADKFERY